MLAVIWTKLGKWLAAAGGLMLMALGMCWFAFRRGEKRQADRGAAAREKADEQADMEARATWSDATRAANEVQHQATSEPPPDTQARDDFDNTF